MNAFLYQPIFLAITGAASYMTVFRYLSSPDYRFQKQRSGFLLPLIISIIFIFWIGGRPVNGAAFGDTVNYAFGYINLNPIGLHISMDLHSEWLWGWIMVACKSMGMDVHAWFTVIEAGYILSVLWAVKRFMPTNPMLGMLFVFTSLMFFTFGTNGLRNGLACHIMLLAMSFFLDDKYVTSGLLCLMAFGIHRSVMLPIAGMIAGRFLIKDVRYAIYIWISSILLSLAVGGAAISFFASLGFDDRMSSYNTDAYSSSFSSSGFRWDFLLYSSFPVIMGWYVCVKRKIKDDWYRTLCVTYCLCNAFWVLVISVAFSNRFAYLSWFMYPIIIAYPLIHLPVWEDQDRKTALILAAYCGFTLFMQTIYW